MSLVAVLGSVALLSTAASASAAWHYRFKSFVETSYAGRTSAETFVQRCAGGQVGDWRFNSQLEIEVPSSFEANDRYFELEVKAKMPITTGFRQLHNVDVRWSARLPKDPDLAALLSEHFDRLAESQSDFYEGMSVRWRPAKQKLDIRHKGLFFDGNKMLAPGKFTTPFKPKPGC